MAARGYWQAFTVVKRRVAAEPEASVRAVLGHWLIGYIHPYMDGNGRIARFLMKLMLASGGYPWTVIRLQDRARYLGMLGGSPPRDKLQGQASMARCTDEFQGG